MSTVAVEKATLFHISLNVSNIPRAIAFYRVLFGVEPSKCHDLPEVSMTTATSIVAVNG